MVGALLGRQRPPTALLVAGVVVGLGAVLPAAYLLVVVGGDLGAALDETLAADTALVVLRSLGLTAAVCLTAIAIALPLAWLTSRTDLPGRRVWATLAALPLVIPSYVGAYLIIAALGPNGMLQDLL